jgi:hypothetical protein
MSSIVVSPLSANTTPAFEVVNLEILVKNEDFLGFFDLIEVWRSRGNASGPYEELTAPSWLPARLPKTAGDAPTPAVTGPTVNIVGKTLEFVLKEKDTILVFFSGTDPLTYAQVAAQITAQSSGRLRAYVDEDVQMTVETLEPGTGAALRVLPGDAASLLALPLTEPESLVFGRDARIQLIKDLNTYRFSDISGSTAYYYKTRFRNRSTSAVSEFSLPFGVAQSLGVSPANLVCGYLNLVSLDGKPLVGREVSLCSPFTGELVENRLLAGNPLMKRTDHEGHVEFTLVRGQKYALAISGLNLAKELVAPTDSAVSSFSLVSASAGTQDDYFRVREPEVTVMERRHI